MEDKKQDTIKQQLQGPVEVERTRNRKVYVPRVDIYEAEDAIFVVADMPGVDASSVDIVIEKDVLTINGTVEQEGNQDCSVIYSEYDTGDYQRAFTLSDEIDRDKIDATVKNGVLRLKLPKAEKAKVKKIEIKAA